MTTAKPSGVQNNLSGLESGLFKKARARVGVCVCVNTKMVFAPGSQHAAILEVRDAQEQSRCSASNMYLDGVKCSILIDMLHVVD